MIKLGRQKVNKKIVTKMKAQDMRFFTFLKKAFMIIIHRLKERSCCKKKAVYTLIFLYLVGKNTTKYRKISKYIFVINIKSLKFS